MRHIARPGDILIAFIVQRPMIFVSTRDEDAESEAGDRPGSSPEGCAWDDGPVMLDPSGLRPGPQLGLFMAMNHGCAEAVKAIDTFALR